MTNALSIFNQLRPVTVGFDDIFEDFGKMFDENILRGSYKQTYPPYDIVKVSENNYNIQLALAGYSKKDIEVKVEENTLVVKSIKESSAEKQEVIHQGISKRYFERQFTIADDVEVLGAELKDGLLTVSLERIVPEHKKPKTIAIK
jgi:molecular chaperone IbpA